MNVEGGDDRGGPVPPVLELDLFGPARRHRLGGMLAGSGADRGLLVDRQDKGGGRLGKVEGAHVGGPLPEERVFLRVSQPLTWCGLIS